MAFARTAFSKALAKNLKPGVRASSAVVKTILQKKAGITGTRVTDTQVRKALQSLKEEGMLGYRAETGGEYKFKEEIKKEIKADEATAAAEKRKEENLKASLRMRIMKEEQDKKRITEALSTGKEGKEAKGDKDGKTAPASGSRSPAATEHDRPMELKGAAVGGAASRATAPRPVMSSVGGGPSFSRPAGPSGDGSRPSSGKSAPRAAPAEKEKPLPDMFGEDD